MSDALQVNLQQNQPISLDIDFACKPGELLALVGPSGSGKSTVLRAIAGLQNISNGTIKCAGRLWQDTESAINLPTQRRRVGMVFQHYALFPHKSALDNVMLAMQELPARQRREQAEDWLHRTNMTGLEMRKPAQLSGGQRQRVALARALARNPDVLLLDEPFSAVDQQTRRILYRELAQLRASLNIPMILVTHDIHEVQQLADSLCLMHRGRTLQYGPVQDVLSTPVNKEIAKLLGHQNLVKATVSRQVDSHTEFRLSDADILRGPRTDLAQGATVTLLISPSAININRPDETETGPNQLQGIVRDAVGMGDELSIRFHLNNVTKSLRFRIPVHLAREHKVESGIALAINIRTSGIHAIADAG